jgi:ferrous iron transport protein A
MWLLGFSGGKGKNQSPAEPDGDKTLGGALTDREYTLIRFSGGEKFRDKIYAMGLNPGARFRVLINNGHGPIEIEVRRNKLAIGRGMAEKLLIKEHVSR